MSENLRLEFNYGYGHLDRFGLNGNTQHLPEPHPIGVLRSFAELQFGHRSEIKAYMRTSNDWKKSDDSDRRPDSAVEDFSLILGGPLYQLYLRTRVARPPLELLRRRTIAFALVCWLPLLLLSLAEGHAVSGVHVPFLLDIEIYARFLVSLPLLIVGEVEVHKRMLPIIRQFRQRNIISEKDSGRFEDILASTMRLRNSILVEIILVVLAFTVSNWIWREHIILKAHTWYASPAGEDLHLTAAGYWYAGVSLPILRFILYRWYFRLFLWYQFLWRVRRLPLHLNLFHPDRAAGLGFLSGSIFAFAPLLVGQTVLLAGFIGGRIVHDNAHISTFKLDAVGIVILLMLLVVLPLCFFLSHLRQARRTALGEYGILASRYVDDFRSKWILGTSGGDEQVLGTSDIQSLADLGNAYTVISEMRLFPFGKRALLQLGVLLLAPLLPLTLAEIPLEEIAQRIIKIAL